MTAEAVEEAEYVAAGGHAFESAADRNYLRRLRALRKESEETLEPWQRAELQRTAKKFGDDWWQVKRTPTAGA